MELLCIQSQEHPELPKAELNAVMECENIEANLNVITEGLVILTDIPDEKCSEYYEILTIRLGYTHEVHEIITTSSRDTLNDDVSSIDWGEYIDESFAVRVKRFTSEIDTVATERKVGSLILENCNNIKVNLKKPKSLVRIVAFKDTVYVAIEKIKLNKKHFEETKPHKRPFFYPGSMSPKLARCMVNLSRVKEGQLLLDPFCGTGGILIEAGIIGCKVVGSDIYWKMKNGTAINLEHYGITDYRTFNLDVRELKMYERVAAVVTDPPYGISTTTGDIDGEDIFKEFFKAIYDNMKDDAYLCMASPHYVDLKPMADDVGFEIVEQYGIKMHRSLTRIISVIRKKNRLMKNK
ncbi:TIGR01177 family methyltransferase [Methanobrevibacter sp.]|uniref:TIGR01177 family methyltransferase n=1 Tax=Methanobrevibacter sp. TaxID=66852 RepID=UPI0026E067A2|nr:TIGR01177 family methyltransferase [Methanobrevibacter sp.]MDO5860453.1 TIGR01177 family methyltransferase [Methanobrevibacter sp.]